MLVRKMFEFTLAVALVVVGGQVAMAGETEDRIAERLTTAIPGLKVTEVRESEAPGLYEVYSNNGDTIYTTRDGGYLLTGDLLQVTDNGIANVSEKNRAIVRKSQMEEFGARGVISYPADGEEKAEIAVFTDIDCPYCRKLHAEMGEINSYGITVHYYGFPRSGPNTPSFNKYVSVWCSDDQQAAMNAAKTGKPVDAGTCENPVRDQFNLGGQVGVTGTPAIVLEDGNMVRGYVPARKLAEGLGLL
ncbi:protein-disulfide isomerase [Marinobacter lipolyticus SM19]|uniref:Thiol:disulfide interchange protein n=2 Tax=Marinobacter lipolyticus TaxID=209639 RepID=R8AYR8_9GAMM|nr:DsbC family protein [Marinobacter lipolyticus]EON91474.1 protein-disulfide isomerase [Marinobacter lipolyticus SM19]